MQQPLLTRRLFIAGSSLTGLVVLAGCQTEMVLQPTEPGYSVDTTESALPIVNSLRAKNKLPPLFNDPVAANAAKDQAIRMARFGKMSHFLGSDASFLDRMKRLDVTLPAAENIAVGQQTTDRAVDAWIRSHKHLVNMLGDYRGMGVAVAYRSSPSDRPFWSMVLSNIDKPVKVRGA